MSFEVRPLPPNLDESKATGFWSKRKSGATITMLTCRFSTC